MTAALLFAVLGDDGRGNDDAWPRAPRQMRTGRRTTAPTERRATASHAFIIPAELVARIRGRDASALDAVMQVALEPLVRFAYGFVRSRDAADDVVQEVFVRVWAQGEAWSPGDSAAAYLYAAVRNRALNTLRAQASESRLKERVRAADGVDWSMAAPAGSSPEQLAQWNELMAAFDAALSTLTERQRSALVLRFEQGRTVPEIATILDISPKAAEKLVSRGIRELRVRLERVVR